MKFLKNSIMILRKKISAFKIDNGNEKQIYKQKNIKSKHVNENYNKI